MAALNWTDPNNPNHSIPTREKTTRGGSTLIFPSDVDTLVNNRIVLAIHEYQRGNPLSPGSLATSPIHNIVLPLPLGLSDSTNLDYRDSGLGFVGGALGTLGNGTSTAADLLRAGGTAAAASWTGRAVSAVAAQAEGFRGISGLAESAVRAAGMSTNYATNPNLAMSFEGVRLRDHEFSWQLMARSEAESQTISQIIKALRSSVLPRKYEGANFAFAYPYVFKIYFEPSRLMVISDLGCFVESMTVTYDGASAPAFYRNTNAPVTVDLKMRFRERGVLTSEDYGAESVPIIGEKEKEAVSNFAEKTQNGAENLFNNARRAVTDFFGR